MKKNDKKVVLPETDYHLEKNEWPDLAWCWAIIVGLAIGWALFSILLLAMTASNSGVFYYIVYLLKFVCQWLLIGGFPALVVYEICYVLYKRQLAK